MKLGGESSIKDEKNERNNSVDNNKNAKGLFMSGLCSNILFEDETNLKCVIYPPVIEYGIDN